MIWKFPPAKLSKDYFLALDIGTSSVKSLIFQKEGEKIIILGASIEYFEPFGIFDSWAFQEDLIKKTILKAIEGAKIAANFQEKIEFILLGLPANILKNRVGLENFKRANPKEKIGQKEKEEIIKKVFDLSQREISEKISTELGIINQDLRYLEPQILEMKIDGYEVSDFLGFSGQNLELRILNSFLLKDYLGKIEKILRNLNLKISKLVPPAGNLTLALSEKKLDALFLDIGGEITQIICFQNGKINQISEFSVGGEIFSRQLSETLGITKSEADDLKVRYSQKILTEEVRKKIREIFVEPSQIWFNNLKIKLKEFSFLPLQIFCFGGASSLPDIEEILINGDWENLLYPNNLKINILLPKDLKNIVDKTLKIENPQNIPPLLVCYG